MVRIFCLAIVLFLYSGLVQADSYTYESISKRYSDIAMSEKEVRKAKMEGECLVGLKDLNFKKQENFDAVAEWTNYRSISLLDHLSPCTVLIIMEVAQSKLKNKK